MLTHIIRLYFSLRERVVSAVEVYNRKNKISRIPASEREVLLMLARCILARLAFPSARFNVLKLGPAPQTHARNGSRAHNRVSVPFH